MSIELQTFEKWKNSPTNDLILEKELNLLKKPSDIKKNFSQRMEFGTAGIRGILGAGTNKINIRTIGAAAQAYAQFLIENNKNLKEISVVIAHDNRHNNILFTQEVAKVMSYYKIKTYIFENNDLQPTPLASFAIRKLKATGGAIITASHNPAIYNGFKIYNSLGAQFTSKDTAIISKKMAKIDFLNINKDSFNPIYINQTLINEYINEVLSIQLRKDDQKQLKIVYSPLHGTGQVIGPKILRRMNFFCKTVNEQMTSDPNFSNTKSPNPEIPVAYKKGIALAKKTKSDIVLLTDPDSDRIGVVVKYKRRYKYLTGNQIAVLYLNFMLTQLKIANKLPKNGYIVKSNVSTDLARIIANRFGIKVYETNVGFKNIAKFIEKKKDEKFLFAFEESYGFLINKDIARDKDAMQGLVAIAEAANYYKTQGSDLFTELLKIYKQYGFYRNVTELHSINPSATERLFIRILKMKSLGDKQVVRIDDYRKKIDNQEPTNMLKIYLQDSGWFAIRPSGTEPKVKFYYNLYGKEIKQVVILEGKIKNDIEEVTENNEIGKISKKVILKFLFFVAILVSILVVLLFTIYHTTTHGSVGIFIQIWNLMKHANKFWLFMLIISAGIPIVFTSLFVRRALWSLDTKLPFHRSLISSSIAICVSSITPFASGGSIASYWYLRRKNLPRKKLLAAFLMNSLVFQFTLVIRTFVFIPIGFWLFSDIYFANTLQSHLILILTMIGFSFDIFATIMISLLTMNKYLQNRIVNRAIILLEWMPFIVIADPLKLTSQYEYEFYALRSGMKKIISNKLLMLELLFYETVPIFISGYLFGALAMRGVANTNIPGGIYINFLTGSNLIRAANNMIPLPGGTGTTEWMSTVIYSKIFVNMSAQFTGLVRAWIYIIPMTASFLLLIFVYVNERINYKINEINKNNKLKSLRIKKQKNRFRFYVFCIFLPIIIGGSITAIILLFY